MKKINYWLPLWIAFGIAAGIFIGNIFAPLDYFSSRKVYAGNKKIDEVLGYISKSYVDTVNIDDLVERAIPSILSGLDPHSTYIPASEMKKNDELLNGHFSGIGVEFIVFKDTVAIVNIIPGGPSEAVGIQPFDRIVYVNDSLFTGIAQDKVFQKLRGQNNTKVKLGIKRASSPEIIDITVTRADVPVKSVNAAYMLTNNIGYIRISQFGSTTYNEFIGALAKLKSQGCNSFIIDLQQNTGGYLEAARRITQEFLSNGELIFYTEGRTYKRQNVFADGSGSCQKDQVLVLLDESSASASEVFSGAIQDNDRGLIVGRRSFGKGLVQNQFKFEDESAMRLTIARYHTPSGRCIQKEYEVGKSDSYNQDLVNRYLRGEFYNQDSIKMDNLPLFHTLSGRPVYGNDGIMPDVFVPRDTIGENSYSINIFNSGILREYAFTYSEKNKNYFKEHYNNWEDALQYIINQPLVNELVIYAEQKGVRRRPQLIEESRTLLKDHLEALILKNIYGDEAFYPVFQRNDYLLKKAVNLIEEGKATPEAIANEKYKNNK